MKHKIIEIYLEEHEDDYGEDVEFVNVIKQDDPLFDKASEVLKEFAYILGCMELEGKSLEDAVSEIKILRISGGKFELLENAKKWSDPKPIIALVDWGLLSTKKENFVLKLLL